MLKKISDMNRICLILFSTFFCSISFGQSEVNNINKANQSTVTTQLFINSLMKPVTKKIYNECDFLTINCIQTYNDSINSLNSQGGKYIFKDSILKIHITGKLSSVTDSSMTIFLLSEKIKIDNKSEKQTNIHILNDGNFDPCKNKIGTDYSSQLRTINFAKINSIGSSEYKDIHIALNDIIGFALFNAIIVSPLASMNFKTGNFNQTSYYSISLTSLAVVAVILPIDLFLKQGKVYKIKSDRTTPAKGYYYLDNK
jgi:hypothetical protein